ncbi:MAG: hypothetical protein M1816_003951 [Peltula sp. TS41687]|nr:MAG: hypothetical protein M1816_003951 [Peltula sp. TS41687]
MATSSAFASGGGPIEDNITGFLVRSTATNWTKGSVLAVDAGTHLAAIARILEEQSESIKEDPVEMTKLRKSRRPRNGVTAPSTSNHSENGICVSSGPFAGLHLPFKSTRANAAYITRELISTFLITHPHLDHISGFVVNTAAFQNTKSPKRLAAVESTIDAIKTHIFNDIIWPNLSNEEGGVGLVTYKRLVEGDSKGYENICEGLGVTSWMISHGSCMKSVEPGRGSVGSIDHQSQVSTSMAFSQARTPSIDHDRKGSGSSYHRNTSISTNISTTRNNVPMRIPSAYDSTAYFIRDDHSGKEILIFGDVEPDSISLSPRTELIWDQAAPKIVGGVLRGIFIECSYDDSQSDGMLFGHLVPRHLIAELRSLGDRVLALREHQHSSAQQIQPQAEQITRSPERKRKRARFESLNGQDSRSHAPLPLDHDYSEPELHDPTSRPPPASRRRDESRSRRRTRRSPSPYHHYHLRSRSRPRPSPHPQQQTSPSNGRPNQDNPLPLRILRRSLTLSPARAPPPSSSSDSSTSSSDPPLKGLQIIIIHMKDPLKDACDREGGLTIEESILAQLKDHEKQSTPRLGCKFRVSRSGQDIWL